jgi:parallel beta helix pectate lyase-like protein
MRRPLIWASLAAALAAATTANTTAQTIIYVDDDAPEGGDGRSWFAAFHDLQDALDAVRLTPRSVLIKVAEGVYLPDRGTGDRNASFELSSRDSGTSSGFSLSIKGGFAGLGHQDPEIWDPGEYVSILSGDLLGNDTPDDLQSLDDNSYHIAKVIDPERIFLGVTGVTFRGGNADSTEQADSPFRGKGGAMVIEPDILGSFTYLVRVVIDNCRADTWGGGIYSRSQNVRIIDTVFEDNHAEFGGSISINASADIWIENTQFLGSSARRGGALGIYDDAVATVVESKFLENNAQTSGGAIDVAGIVTLDGCLLAGNSADFGGAISNPFGQCSITATTIATNFAQDASAIGIGSGGTVSVIGSVLWSGPNGSSEIFMAEDTVVEIRESLVRNGLDGVDGNTDGLEWNNVISEDPLFVDEFGPDNDPMTTADNDYQLATGSPCIDQVRTLGPSYTWGLGLIRPWSANCSCLTVVDMGAYEYLGTDCPPATSRLYVDLAAPPDGDGLSWSSAMRTIEDALAVPGVEEIWVAQGTYFTPEHDGGLEMSCWWTGLRILGGFNGTETDENQRDPSLNLTIVSGDRLGNDIDGSDESRLDNASKAVLVQGALATIDGFVFEAFDAFTSSEYVMFQARNADVRFVNCTFQNLNARVVFSLWTSAMELDGCDISNNFGKLVSANYNTFMNITGCRVAFNETNAWRSLIQLSSAHIENSQFLANFSHYALIDSDSQTDIIGSTFIGNESDTTFNSMIELASASVISNSAFLANDVPELSSSRGGPMLFTNNLVWNNPDIIFDPWDHIMRHNLSDIELPGPGNIVAADPGVARLPWPGPDEQWGTPDDDFGDLRPAPYSPLIDAGDSNAVPEALLFDLAGLPRIVDDQQVLDSGPVSPAVDIGPYESQSDSCGGDWNSDSQNNIDDIIAYLSNFDDQRLRADLNRDSLWDFYDLQLFLRDFASGCP